MQYIFSTMVAGAVFLTASAILIAMIVWALFSADKILHKLKVLSIYSLILGVFGVILFYSGRFAHYLIATLSHYPVTI